LLSPDDQRELLTELSQRGDKIGWDTCMRYAGQGEAGPGNAIETAGPGCEVEEVAECDDTFWAMQRRALSVFGVERPAAAQLESVEQRLVESGAKRWVTIRVEGEMLAFGAIQAIDDNTVYIDNVLTFPEVRGRGYATAIVAHFIRENAGTREMFLLAEAGRGPAALYERLGFRAHGAIASSLRTVK
jgi:GNAT superfamily N-acetyltransferase